MEAQPVGTQPKKSNRTVIIVVVVLLVLCCCCALAVGGYYGWQVYQAAQQASDPPIPVQLPELPDSNQPENMPEVP